MRREPLVFAFYQDKLYIFERTDKHSASVFGGPLEARTGGRRFGPKPLHHIACLRSRHLPAFGQHFVSDLHLTYGMHYSGCALSYRLSKMHEIELLHIAPERSSNDWPYPHFPPLLPYLPLRLDDAPQFESYDGFAQRFPNMPAPQPAELMVAVPPPATIGLSLWGGSDGHAVTIVFECDLTKKEVKAYSVTS